jgi:medium-chain acyl-[acyl-carrier-protein] hydrolase
MSGSNVHARSFDLRYSEMDGRGEATPVAMLGLMEEAAFTHCEETGWSVPKLLDAGYGWILLRGGLEMAAYPEYGKRFTIETWCSETRRFYGAREYRIKAQDGTVLGWARSLWVFYGLERRRPVPVLDDIVKAWAPDGVEAGPMELGEVGFPGAPAAELLPRFEVRRSDIDTNGHVHNLNYLSWALEALPQDLRDGAYLSSLRGHYRREVTLGSTISAAFEAVDEQGGCAHGVFAQNGSERYLAAAAQSRWLPRASSRVRAA